MIYQNSDLNLFRAEGWDDNNESGARSALRRLLLDTHGVALCGGVMKLFWMAANMAFVLIGKLVSRPVVRERERVR